MLGALKQVIGGVTGGVGPAAGGLSGGMAQVGKSLVSQHASGLMGSMMQKSEIARPRTAMPQAGGIAQSVLGSMAEGRGLGGSLASMGAGLLKTAIKQSPLGMAASTLSHSPLGQMAKAEVGHLAGDASKMAGAASTAASFVARPLQQAAMQNPAGLAMRMMPQGGGMALGGNLANGVGSHLNTFASSMQPIPMKRPGLNG